MKNPCMHTAPATTDADTRPPEARVAFLDQTFTSEFGGSTVGPLKVFDRSGSRITASSKQLDLQRAGGPPTGLSPLDEFSSRSGSEWKQDSDGISLATTPMTRTHSRMMSSAAAYLHRRAEMGIVTPAKPLAMTAGRIVTPAKPLAMTATGGRIVYSHFLVSLKQIRNNPSRGGGPRVQQISISSVLNLTR